MTEIARLAAAIKTISEVYLGRVVAKGDEPAILKWSLRLADYSTRLAALVAPPLTAEERMALAPAVEPPPNFGNRQEMSAGLYGDWVTAWFQRTFPEAYADWPPTVHAVAPGAIADAAKADGCLAQVCAAGVLGDPAGPWADLGDWSLYTALTGTTDNGGFVHRVWHMGKLVGSMVGGPGDGLDYAKSLGFNW